MGMKSWCGCGLFAAWLSDVTDAMDERRGRWTSTLLACSLKDFPGPSFSPLVIFINRSLPTTTSAPPFIKTKLWFGMVGIKSWQVASQQCRFCDSLGTKIEFCLTLACLSNSWDHCLAKYLCDSDTPLRFLYLGPWTKVCFSPTLPNYSALGGARQG